MQWTQQTICVELYCTPGPGFQNISSFAWEPRESWQVVLIIQNVRRKMGDPATPCLTKKLCLYNSFVTFIFKLRPLALYLLSCIFCLTSSAEIKINSIWLAHWKFFFCCAKIWTMEIYFPLKRCVLIGSSNNTDVSLIYKPIHLVINLFAKWVFSRKRVPHVSFNFPFCRSSQPTFMLPVPIMSPPPPHS